jgi:hypothetical protein
VEEFTFDSTYIINKGRYDEFLKNAENLAIAAYTIPAFTNYDIYELADLERDIAIKVVWKPQTTVQQIKEFDKVWFLEKFE